MRPGETFQPTTNVGYGSKLRMPRPRRLRADIPNPTFEDLFNLAMLRIDDAINCNPNNRPPRLFPLAESTRATFFTHNDWDNFGDLETELGRLNYTLSCVPERGFPSRCQASIMFLLAQNSILESWRGTVPTLKNQVEVTAREVVHRMQSFRIQQTRRAVKADFITVPMDYLVDECQSDASIFLWRRSLAEASEQVIRGSLSHTSQFLEIHAFVKDPIGGLRRDFGRQVSLFNRMVQATRASSEEQLLTTVDWQRAIAQAAQESSYLAIPQLEDVSYIHFHAHQQLPYIYTCIDELARSEFTETAHVLEIVEEILSGMSSRQNRCCIPPIALAFCPSFKTDRTPLNVIIDGNHRVAAVVLLRFFAMQHEKTDIAEEQRELIAYCQNHRLGAKWQIDLTDILRELRSPAGEPYTQLIAAKRNLIRTFEEIRYIPALVVQEENFHTICNQRSSGSKRVWLLPMHQTFYNEESLGFAFPRAAQAHGRPLRFKPLPLLTRLRPD